MCARSLLNVCGDTRGKLLVWLRREWARLLPEFRRLVVQKCVELDFADAERLGAAFR